VWLGFEGENEVTDTAQIEGATAFDDRSQKNRTPEGLAQAYLDPDVTSITNDVAAAETGSTSSTDADTGSDTNGAHVAGEGTEGDAEELAQ
jgi:hypothetical protein